MTDYIIFAAGIIVGALVTLAWVALFIVPVIDRLREQIITIKADLVHDSNAAFCQPEAQND